MHARWAESQYPEFKKTFFLPNTINISQYPSAAYDANLNLNLNLHSNIVNNVYPIDGQNISWRFLKLDQTQYKVNRYAGIISLNTSVSDDQAIAVAYRTEGFDPTRSDDDVFYGQLGTIDTTGGKPLILKLVKPKNPNWRTRFTSWVGGSIASDKRS